ncbi:MAG: cob(I)yrinic acid a,c-diamide adenosyltransferase [Paracoccaceae bacterium]|nr:cob(I)yrinic acid a,c-diamide adenosyltransferase [Paracoccaceae bacterium]
MKNAADHKAKMQKLQSNYRHKVSQTKDPGRGLVFVHTGKGKGKSSSAFGVIIRALGWGQKVAVVQFIKGKWVTGERRFFKTIEDQVSWHTMGDGFTWDTQDRNRDTKAAKAAFAKACDMMAGADFDLMVLDEINIAMRYDYLSIEQVLDGLKARAARTSVILTGRDAKPEICGYADLVTEMTEVKHPFQAGIKAQKGLDY